MNVPPENHVQFVGALGAAILAQRRLQKLNLQDDASRTSVDMPAQN